MVLHWQQQQFVHFVGPQLYHREMKLKRKDNKHKKGRKCTVRANPEPQNSTSTLLRDGHAKKKKKIRFLQLKWARRESKVLVTRHRARDFIFSGSFLGAQMTQLDSAEEKWAVSGHRRFAAGALDLDKWAELTWEIILCLHLKSHPTMSQKSEQRDQLSPRASFKPSDER